MINSVWVAWVEGQRESPKVGRLCGYGEECDRWGLVNQKIPFFAKYSFTSL